MKVPSTLEVSKPMEIAISGKNGAGKVLLIDDEDVELLEGKSVYMVGDPNRKDGMYPAIERNGKLMRVHRLISESMGLIGEIDHVNRDKCDSRRQNLREATASQNQRNKGLNTHNTSGLKGVSWHKRSKKWVSGIMVNGRHEYLGRFTCKFEAAKAYDRRALEVDPIHASTNASLGLFPDTLCQCANCHKPT
jgi:AP2 domain/HNH endonuclease